MNWTKLESEEGRHSRAILAVAQWNLTDEGQAAGTNRSMSSRYNRYFFSELLPNGIRVFEDADESQLVAISIQTFFRALLFSSPMASARCAIARRGISFDRSIRIIDRRRVGFAADRPLRPLIKISLPPVRYHARIRYRALYYTRVIVHRPRQMFHLRGFYAK